ncbi:uncharacterized protein TNCV_261411 [Trichonephila clavipes]|nr:uncharacterized protein TNCV_261411 [Trichonephila clavipes]
MGAGVHEQMSRSGGQSDERPPVFKSPRKLGTHLLTTCSRDERYSGFCPDLLNRIGISYPWATFEVLAEHPEYGERLAPIKPRGYPFKGDGWRPVTFPGYWQKHSKKHHRCKCSSHKTKHKHVHSKMDFCGDKGIVHKNFFMTQKQIFCKLVDDGLKQARGDCAKRSRSYHHHPCY